MKRFFSVLVAICMVFSMIPALAESLTAEDILGIWYAVSMRSEEGELAFASLGMNIELELKDDGTAVMTTFLMDETVVENGIWELKDGAVDILIEGPAFTATLQDDLLVAEEGNEQMILSRTAPEAAEDNTTALMSLFGALDADGEASEDDLSAEDMAALMSLFGAMGAEDETAEGEAAEGDNVRGLFSSLLGSDDEGAGTGLGGLLGGILGGEGTDGAGMGGLLGGILGGEGTDGAGMSGLLGGLLSGAGEGLDPSALTGMLSGFLGENGEGLSGLLSNLFGENGLNASVLTDMLGNLFGEGGLDLSSLLNKALAFLEQKGINLSTLMGKLGGLFNGNDRSIDTSELTSLLGDIFGSEETGTAEETTRSAVPVMTYAAAESKEQFYGVWNLNRVAFAEGEDGFSLEMSDVSEMLGVSLPLQLVLSDNAFVMKFEDRESAETVEMELVNGTLVASKDGEGLNINLTDAGELVLDMNALKVVFTPAAE